MRQNCRVLNRGTIVTYSKSAVTAVSIATAAIVVSVFLASANAGTYSDAVLADTPLAYYRLDETNGTTADNLGSGGATIDGTYVEENTGSGGYTLGQDGPKAPTFPGLEADNRSPNFQPITASGPFPRVEVLDDGTGPLSFSGAFTLEAWIKRDPQVIAAGNNEGIVSRYVGAGDQRSYLLFYNSSSGGQLGFNASELGTNASTAKLLVNTPIPEGEWTHVAAVYEPSTRMTIYVDGMEVGETTTGVPASIYDGAGDFWIGHQFSDLARWTFEGNIDEVAVYTTALSDEQIAAHYAAAPEPTTCVMSLIGVACVLLRRRRAAAAT